MPESELAPRLQTLQDPSGLRSSGREDAGLSDGDEFDADGPDQVSWRPPRWASPVSLLISVLGLAVATYLTYEHYTGNKTLACSGNGAINCAKVTTSAESHILGIPVAVLGLAFFAGMTLLCLPFAWRRPEPIVRYARLLGVTTGIGMILWLIYAELFIIKAICLWCTGDHALTVVLFAAVLLATVTGIHKPVADYDDELDDDLDYDDEEELPERV